MRFAAQNAVAKGKLGPIPPHLQDAHYKSSGKLGHGIGYKYAHDYPNHYVTQQYLPDDLVGTVFYEPSGNGYEKKIAEWMDFIRTADSSRADGENTLEAENKE